MTVLIQIILSGKFFEQMEECKATAPSKAERIEKHRDRVTQRSMFFAWLFDISVLLFLAAGVVFFVSNS